MSAETEGFVHRVRPAAGAEPVTTTAPRSVFDIGVIDALAQAVKAPTDRLACAMFNTGELLIELPGADAPALRLSAEHAAELIGYLRTLQGGLK